MDALLIFIGFKKHGIMTAQQAKASTQYFIDSRNQKCLKDILTKINEAIAGNIYSPPSFGVRIPGRVTTEVESELKELGYEVEHRAERDGYWDTHISWA